MSKIVWNIHHFWFPGKICLQIDYFSLIFQDLMALLTFRSFTKKFRIVLTDKSYFLKLDLKKSIFQTYKQKKLLFSD